MYHSQAAAPKSAKQSAHHTQQLAHFIIMVENNLEKPLLASNPASGFSLVHHDHALSITHPHAKLPYFHRIRPSSNETTPPIRYLC